MGFQSVLSMAHKWILDRIQPGELLIDATAGGGVDTLFLATATGPKGKVIAFDIQRDALDKTKLRLDNEAASNKLAKVELVLGSHHEMNNYVSKSEKAAAIMFNLGYFPGGDQSIITKPETTISALNQALSLLRAGGIITCTLYPGHPGGDLEAETVTQWAASLDQLTASSVIYRQLQRPHAPYLIAIEKK